MQTVLIVIHLLIVIALVGVVLIQRSEGGGLGIGGGSGFMTARGTKNALTRLTAILAICFFATSIILVVVDSVSNPASDILNRIPTTEGQAPATGQAPADGAQPSILEQLGGKPETEGDTQSQPQSQQAPSVPAQENPVPQQPENPVPGN
ncbi:preprotein translocase subunit SecG [Bartonella sp. LJL80]